MRNKKNTLLILAAVVAISCLALLAASMFYLQRFGAPILPIVHRTAVD